VRAYNTLLILILIRLTQTKTNLTDLTVVDEDDATDGRLKAVIRCDEPTWLLLRLTAPIPQFWATLFTALPLNCNSGDITQRFARNGTETVGKTVFID